MALWNRAQTLLLIKLYKDNQSEYLIDRKEWFSNIAKDLEEIRPNTTYFDVERKIRILKSQYCRESQKIKALKSQNKDYTPKLWCYNLLQFFDHKISSPKTDLKEDHNYCGNVPYFTPDRLLKMKPKFQSIGSETSDEFVKIISDSIITSTEATDSDRDIIHLLGETTKHFREPTETLMPAANTLEIEVAPAVQHRTNKAKNFVFAKFVCEELYSIEDKDILEETKWNIQMLLHKASKKNS